MTRHTIRFLPENQEVTVAEGESFLQAASLAGIPVRASCGGKGTCGRCRMIVREGAVRQVQTGKLSPAELAAGHVLACQTFPEGAVVVEVPEETRLAKHQVLLADGPESEAGALPELDPLFQEIPLQLAVPTLEYSPDDAGGQLLAQTGLSRQDIYAVVCAGNTTMTHLLLGIYPDYLRLEPYTPGVFSPPPVSAAGLGLQVNDRAQVYCLPAIAGYVGGDVIAGARVIAIDRAEELTLFIDVGTNGEMVLGNREWLLACACSAGPAFEGSGLRHGMRATPGVLSRRVRDEVEELAKKITYLELSAGKDFFDEFVSAMFLPHTDLSLFPSLAGWAGSPPVRCLSPG